MALGLLKDYLFKHMPSDFDRQHAEKIKAHMAKKLGAGERCSVCKGAHPSHEHKKHEKQASHNMRADLHNWKEREVRQTKNFYKDSKGRIGMK
jgi:DNA repair exonuclease SbcCD ATPase subunit